MSMPVGGLRFDLVTSFSSSTLHFLGYSKVPGNMPSDPTAILVVLPSIQKSSVLKNLLLSVLSGTDKFSFLCRLREPKWIWRESVTSKGMRYCHVLFCVFE